MSSLPLRTAVSDTYPLPSNATARVGFGLMHDVLKEFTEAGEIQLECSSTLDIGGQVSTKIQVTTGTTTTITSFGTTYRGPILLRMGIVATITHNATTLRCPGSTNIVTAVGDVLIAWPTATVSGTANGWQVVRLAKAAGDVASVTNAGLVELSTDTEAQAGTDATRCVTPDNLGATVIGIGQTWQNLLASRAIGTTYTNSTGRPIQVSMAAEISSASAWLTMTVSGVSAALSSGTYASGARAEITGVIIPSGGTYSVAASAGTATLQTWAELR